MIHSGVGNLRKAFQRHRLAAIPQPQARILLLFYAVECGLKAAWLTRNRLRDTSSIEAKLKDRGHDLDSYLFIVEPELCTGRRLGGPMT